MALPNSIAHYSRVARTQAIASRWISSRMNQPFSQLYVYSDGSGWVLSQEALALVELANRNGLSAHFAPSGTGKEVQSQGIFCLSQWAMRSISSTTFRKNRVGVSFLHGTPSSFHPEFEENLNILKKISNDVACIHVCNSGMQEYLFDVLKAPDKIVLAPLGINTTTFPLRTTETYNNCRKELGVNPQEILIGSFQKDGEGWEDGIIPKMVKGPDIFVDTVEALYRSHKNVRVLLSGPARGYVKHELERRHIPFTHRLCSNISQMRNLYHACDMVIIASREEGGPKSLLEAMACGVPVISTRVGMSLDVIKHGENGFLAEARGAEGLLRASEHLLSLSGSEIQSLCTNGRETSEKYTYDGLANYWMNVFSKLR